MFDMCFSSGWICILFSLVWPNLLYYNSKEELILLCSFHICKILHASCKECNTSFLLLQLWNLLWSPIAYCKKYCQNPLHLAFIHILISSEDLNISHIFEYQPTAKADLKMYITHAFNLRSVFVVHSYNSKISTFTL